MNENGNAEKPKNELNSPMEGDIFRNCLNEVDENIKSALILICVKELFKGHNKAILEHNINHWAEVTFQNKCEQIEKTYELLTPEQHKEAFEKDRFKEIFGMAVGEVNKEWKTLLGLDKKIIIQNIN